MTAHDSASTLRTGARRALLVLTVLAMSLVGMSAAAAAPSGGSGGAYTDRANLSFTSSNGLTSQYHVYAGGVNPARPVGIMLQFHGDGAHEFKNPTSSYSLDSDGTQGIVAAGKAHNMIVVPVLTPDKTGSLTWWRSGKANAVFVRDLLAKLKTQYNLQSTRVWLNGYSGGAQFITQYYLPAHSSTLDGGGAVLFGGGSLPRGTPAPFAAGVKASFPMHWHTGAADDGSNGFDALSAAKGGKAWYQGQGFRTSNEWPAGVAHGLSGRFGAVTRAQLDRWTAAPVTAPKPTTSPKPVRQGNLLLLNNAWDAAHDTELSYGTSTDEVIFGDWDGDGTDTPAIRRGNIFHLRNSNTGGEPDRVVAYGRAGDTVLVGDWDGNGTDTFGIRRGNVYHLKNTLTGGNADHVTAYGKAGDTVLAGDWDGNRTDTLMVRRGREYHLKNSISGGNADLVFHYGRPGDLILVGNWDGRGGDTLAVRRGNAYHIKNSLSTGVADYASAYGRSTDTVLVGDWDGNGTDTLGVRR